MRLTELEPQFVRYENRSGEKYTIPVQSAAESQGIWFLCPVCFAKNGGPVGTHMVDVTFRDRGVPDDLGSHGTDGQPTRWGVTGDSYENLSTQPSIHLPSEGGCQWHGFVTNGEVL